MASYLTHFSHCHQLVKNQSSSSQQFICDLCRTLGSGLHYRCHACDFDLHEYCANLPQTISFFAHPWHNLHLGPASTIDPRVCDLCRDPVEGFSYRCIPCSFDVHPHCTATKQIVHTELHPEHSLCLAPGLCVCTACHEFNGVWLYRCGMCNVNLHMKCLHGPIKPKVTPQYGQNNTQQIGHCHANNSSSSHGRLGRFMIHVGAEAAVETTANIIAMSSLFLQ